MLPTPSITPANSRIPPEPRKADGCAPEDGFQPETFAVAIPTTHQVEAVIGLLSELERGTVKPSQIYILDNGANANLRDWPPAVRQYITVDPTALGSEGAFLNCISWASRLQAERLLLLDHDAHVYQTTAETLLAACDGFPVVSANINEAGQGWMRIRNSPWRVAEKVREPEEPLPYIDLAPWSGMLLRLDMIPVDLLVERGYYFSCEDSAFCYELRRRGLQIRGVRGALVSNSHGMGSTPWRAYYAVRNPMIYAKQTRGTTIPALSAVGKELLAALWRGLLSRTLWKSLRSLTLGVVDGVRGKQGYIFLPWCSY